MASPLKFLANVVQKGVAFDVFKILPRSSLILESEIGFTTQRQPNIFAQHALKKERKKRKKEAKEMSAGWQDRNQDHD